MTSLQGKLSLKLETLTSITGFCTELYKFLFVSRTDLIMTLFQGINIFF